MRSVLSSRLLSNVSTSNNQENYSADDVYKITVFAHDIKEKETYLRIRSTFSNNKKKRLRTFSTSSFIRLNNFFKQKERKEIKEIR